MFVDIQDKQCRKKYPKLKVKAAEAQACNKVFLRMWLQKMDETNRVHIWVRVALQSSVTMDELLKANDSSWHVPSEAYRNLCDAANKYCICVVALENHFQRIEDRKLFQSGTFKQHWLLQAVQLSKYVNPRHTWCYSGESFMSTCKVLMQSCLKGRGLLQSLHKFIQRYNVALTLDLAEILH